MSISLVSDFGQPWGKTVNDSAGNVINLMSLIHHMIDVASVLNAYLENSHTQTILEKADPTFSSLEHKDRLLYLAALHDIGKIVPGFQFQICNPRPIQKVDHKEAGTIFSFTNSNLLNNNQKQNYNNLLKIYDQKMVISWFTNISIFKDAWHSFVCHHGELLVKNKITKINVSPVNPVDPFYINAWDTLPTNAINLSYPTVTYLKDIVDRLQLLYCIQKTYTTQLPSNVKFWHVLQGLMCASDWIGSTNSNGFVPNNSMSDLDRRASSEKIAQTIINKLKIPDKSAKRVVLSSILPGNFSPRPLQEEIIKLHNIPDILLIEDETGKGKTEAALLYALKLIGLNSVDGVYFALPTRLSATQIYNRIVDASSRMFDPAPSVTLAVSGYHYSSQNGAVIKGKKIGKFEVEWPQDDDDYDDPLKVYQHFASESTKKCMFGSIVVGTVDQAMMATIYVKHFNMRKSLLASKLLIIDEIHASDIYMGTIVQRLIHEHISLGGKVLLMSATLGSERAEQLLKDIHSYKTKITLQQALSTPYPLISHSTNKQIQPPIVIQKDNTPSKEIDIEFIQIKDGNYNNVVKYIGKNCLTGRTLIIRNKVKEAVRLHQELEKDLNIEKLLFNCNGYKCLHHGKYAKLDRRLLDEEIEKYYGKQSTTSSMILVATQTVEQSLDIDSDLLITDLVPMDVLLQRIGRLWRHTKSGRTGKAKCVVLIPDDIYCIKSLAFFNIGANAAYDNILSVIATYKLLEKYKTIKIPDMNRELVELSVHSEELNKIEKLYQVAYLIKY